MLAENWDTATILLTGSRRVHAKKTNSGYFPLGPSHLHDRSTSSVGPVHFIQWVTPGTININFHAPQKAVSQPSCTNSYGDRSLSLFSLFVWRKSSDAVVVPNWIIYCFVIGRKTNHILTLLMSITPTRGAKVAKLCPNIVCNYFTWVQSKGSPAILCSLTTNSFCLNFYAWQCASWSSLHLACGPRDPNSSEDESMTERSVDHLFIPRQETLPWKCCWSMLSYT